MDQRKFGRTGLTVSELCLGTMNFGWTVGRESAFAIMDAYWAAGGNFFEAVAGPDFGILPEAMKAPELWIMEWMRERGISREEVVLSTRMMLGEVQERGAASLEKSIRRCCDGSLERLGTDYLDMLICEWQRALLPIDDTLQALDVLAEDGGVRHVVAANFPLWRAMEAIGRSGARNRCRFEALQTEFSIFLPDPLKQETLDLCNEYDLGLLATSALGGSAPHGGGKTASVFHDGSGRKSNGHKSALLRLEPIMAQRNLSIKEAAMAWVLSHPQVSSVVVSVKSPRQLEQLLQGTSLTLQAGDGPGKHRTEVVAEASRSDD